MGKYRCVSELLSTDRLLRRPLESWDEDELIVFVLLLALGEAGGVSAIESP